jgi:hypothetical protein
MKSILAVVIGLCWLSVASAASFVGQADATFRVVETVDGTTTSVNKTAPIQFTLSTDYSTMHWSLDFDVDLLLAGGPTQSFETRLAATANLSTYRCSGGSSACSHASGQPSVFSFPDATGRAGAGSYFLKGVAEWSLTDRIVSVSRERASPVNDVIWNGQTDNFNSSAAYGYGDHYLRVGDYPPDVTLSTNFSTNSSIKAPGASWTNRSVTSLGRITTEEGGTLEVSLTGMPANITLTESLAGDFNGDQHVDAADYVVWRKGPGLLAPFLTSYDAWTGGYGGWQMPVTTIPEPASSCFSLLGIMAAWTVRRTRSART